MQEKTYQIDIERSLSLNAPYFEVRDLFIEPNLISSAALTVEISYNGSHDLSPGVYFWLLARDTAGTVYPTPLVVDNSACPIAVSGTGTFTVSGGTAEIVALSSQFTGYTLAMSLSSRVAATPPNCVTNSNKDPADSILIGKGTVRLKPIS